ncbi:hypothetical protein HDE_02154 [Halotydeus destructor]|nr:hypothetical protein HDE_02154 [Halotydeus destructor]
MGLVSFQEDPERQPLVGSVKNLYDSPQVTLLKDVPKALLPVGIVGLALLAIAVLAAIFISSLPLIMITIGALNIDECPFLDLSLLLIIGGSLGLAHMIGEILCLNIRNCITQFTLQMLRTAYSIWFIYVTWVTFSAPQVDYHDKKSEFYCKGVVYVFTWIYIFTGISAAVLLSCCTLCVFAAILNA